MNLEDQVSSRVRFALIGAGRMGQNHLRGLSGSSVAEVTTIIDPSREAREQARQLVPAAGAYAELGTALEARNFDAVLIAAPTTTHVQLVTTCCEQGLPILCEKPCGSTTADFTLATGAATASGKPFQVAYWRRFVPQLVSLKEEIARGQFGDLANIGCWQWDEYPADENWRRSSGGIGIDMGVHEFDQLRWLVDEDLGDLRVLPSAVASVPCVPGDAESVQIVGRFPGGTTATISLGRRFPPGDWVWIEVFGTSKYVRTDVLAGAKGDAVFHAALRAQAEDFAHRVESGGAGSGTTIQDAYQALHLAETANGAMREALARVES
jgi:myo-inositol 2-dehydrogenase/D-chiro-inositol 1-dehydrogenase